MGKREKDSRLARASLSRMTVVGGLRGENGETRKDSRLARASL
ncbi:hypothetical protein VSVS12_02420 [Vibrio scophthalmi]|nr:hypothetical protein VSVS12_02420 [Vibrio scophthalmi]